MSRRKSQINLYQTMKIDVLIIGGGPGGSAAAMFLLREGIKPVILEQEEFPRFHIGESLTGEGGAGAAPAWAGGEDGRNGQPD